MVRLTILTLAIVSLLPTAPFGCPPTEPPSGNDGATTPAGNIATSIAAPDAAVAGEEVSLQGAAIPEEDNGEVLFDWLQIAGPGVVLSGHDRPTASFVAPSLESAGRVTILLVTRDASGASGEATASINIAADPNYTPYNWGDGNGGTTGGAGTAPVANAGADQRVSPGDEVTLDGTSSSGRTLRYRWKQISGTPVQLANAESPQATFTVPGYQPEGDNTLVFELTVSDETNRTISDRTKVVISNPNVSDTRVVVETSMGTFKILLYPDDAPITVENFLQYVDDSFYDGTIFHRVIPGFVVQGGGFEPGLNQKETRDPIVLEADNGRKNLRSTVAMARTNDPDSATAQWFVNLVDNDFLDYSEGNDGYAVFGEVYEGMDVVDQIATVQTGEVSGFQDVPLNDVVILSVTRAATE